jgi:hypothetical protein
MFLLSMGRSKKHIGALEMEQQWRVNSGAFLELLKTKEESFQACRRTKLSGLKSDLLCELHYNNK